MKKYLLIITLLLIVGCKKEYKDKLVCTLSNNQRKDIVTINFKNDESVNYDKVSKIIVDDINDAKMYEKDNDYDDIEIVDKEVSMYISESIDNMTKEEVKSLYEHTGYFCQ